MPSGTKRPRAVSPSHPNPARAARKLRSRQPRSPSPAPSRKRMKAQVEAQVEGLSYLTKFIADLNERAKELPKKGQAVTEFRKRLEKLIYSFDVPTISLDLVKTLDIPGKLDEILNSFPAHADETLKAQCNLDARIAKARWKRGVISPSPDNQYLNLSSKRFSTGRSGHIDFYPGQVFRGHDQMAFVGIHHMPGKGIAANEEKGVMSIVISQGGARLYRDEDLGTSLWYCGTRNKDSGEASNATQHMETAFTNGTAIRVIRGKSQYNQYGPSHGYRYDGLYQIMQARTVDKERRFRLFRLPDAENRDVPFAAIQSRPSAERTVAYLKCPIPRVAEQWKRLH
ncbi:hypothetical protein BJ508DRAFT_310102 [Ascobolus immersus RN42]|uniref:YDG domain-containing protein n=1 Tax=Ascobolus immersus RN42 TaxID=1160509 RepID=A0A3N4HWN6_ASCIM|nr:hypothetical protein BJ508DRAFT_310102 [Ascobolus immersus RN42]